MARARATRRGDAPREPQLDERRADRLPGAGAPGRRRVRSRSGPDRRRGRLAREHTGHRDRRPRPARRITRRRAPSDDRSTRSRRAHPDVGHDRPVEARHADASGLHARGRGLPRLGRAHPRGPAHHRTSHLPHQRAGVLAARLDGDRCERRAARALLTGSLPRRGARARRDRVQHDRRHARDAHASTRAPRRRRQPAPPLLHGTDATARTSAGDRAPVRPSDRVRLRPLGEHVRHVLAPRRTALRDDRRGPPAPPARPHQRRARHGRRRRGRVRRGR